MSNIKCQCGNIYDGAFKFCPECATANPSFGASSAPKQIGKFTKVGDNSSSNTIHTASGAKIVTNSLPKAEPVEEYYEDEAEEDSALLSEEETDIEEYFEDEYPEDEDDEEFYESNMSESYDEYTSSEVESNIAAFDSKPASIKTKVLKAPAIKPINQIKSEGTSSASAIRTKSSLNKVESTYNPNHDGYYDDRLPALLDEVTRTSHLDVYLKIALSISCIAALITYCIFYLQV